MEITRDTVLPQGATLTQPLIIRANNITLDGNGATLVGPGRAGDKESFQGIGILAEGCSGVTLRDLRVRGFRVGLSAADAAGWLIEDCDFSDNYTDPAAGWDVLGRFGGILLTRCSKCTLRRNTAQRVWNALDLVACHDCQIVGNDFSHCSNVCLKLWQSCRNEVADNDFSYGLRIAPGEVHARDSAGVLIEAGSDANRFLRNNVTHGGDGIFIRSLNGWVSARNVFVENDCSHAHNNGFEAWCPDNAYIRNKANHCSHGFWLGPSDHTLLLDNEAAWNGSPDGHHNAPERDFGHGGIVFIGDAASHTVLRGNHCHHNNGPGIALCGDTAAQPPRWRIYHWIIENNRLEHNRWGIHARVADLLLVRNNTSRHNNHPDLFDNVTRLTTPPSDPGVPLPPGEGRVRAPKPGAAPSDASLSSSLAFLDGPSRALVGEEVAFDASADAESTQGPLTYAWDIAGQERSGPTVRHVFTQPGFYRVSLTVDDGHQARIAWRGVYVVREAEDPATEGSAALWTARLAGGDGRVVFADAPDALVGRSCLCARVDPCPGGEVELILAPEAPWRLGGARLLTFWLKRQVEHYRGFNGANPVVRLYASGGHVALTPASNANLVESNAPSEARWGWLRFAVPLGGDGAWLCETTGQPSLDAIERLGLAFTPTGPEPFTLWLDGLSFE